jgi:hypothetical protein
MGKHAASPTTRRISGRKKPLDADPNPAVTGLPMQFLRAEGLVLLAGSLAVFFAGLDEAWWLVPLLLFVPDIAIAGYARSHRAGALA